MESYTLDAAALLRTVNSTITSTFGYETLSPSSLLQNAIRLVLLSIFVVPIIYQSFHYFTSELPPSNSVLKRLPGPRSTLRMQAWTAMHKFSKQYGGLFSCTLGGETHIWVAREDVAQDLLVKHAELSSARADLGAYPGVTEDFKYLPLLGYTGMYDCAA
jgi:hypothetical protein